MPRIVPESWMPDCQMRRIITHWTAGLHHASPGDREHYHILIEVDGRLVRGDHTIDDNLSTADDDYAAHTSRLNTGSIGISVCCMAGAMQNPFHPGQFPMTTEQYEAMAIVAADLCERYQIQVTPPTVLGHGEVETNVGVPQAGKWDPMVLPWDPGKTVREVGDAFRQRVEALMRSPVQEEQLPPVAVVLDGRTVTDEGILKEGASWSPLRPLADALGWTVLRIDDRRAVVHTPAGDKGVDAVIRGDRGFVKIKDLCATLGWDPPVWDGATRTVRIQSKQAPGVLPT